MVVDRARHKVLWLSVTLLASFTSSSAALAFQWSSRFSSTCTNRKSRSFDKRLNS